jgi:hypothetical protein
MRKSGDVPDFERITFFPHQRLQAADLTALQEAHREQRWLHNRSLHQWGIALGLGVTGERGDTAVTVQPGYAVDCLGREIILAEAHQMPVPAVADLTEYYLTASYQADADQSVLERRPGVCQPGGAVRLGEEPRLAWVRREQLSEGFHVVLAQASVENCQLSQPLSLAARRSARAGDQPYVASGQTPVGGTVWRFWPDPDNPDVALGVETFVDTSDAHFRYTPQYVTRLGGARLVADAELRGRIAAEFAFQDNDLIARRAVILRSGSEESKTSSEGFQSRFEELAGEVLSVHRVTKSSLPDVLDEISTNTPASPAPDTLYVPFTGDLADSIPKLAEGDVILKAARVIGRDSILPVVEGSAGVVDPTPHGFTLRVILSPALRTGQIAVRPPDRLAVRLINWQAIFNVVDAASIARSPLNWHAVWMGVEA